MSSAGFHAPKSWPWRMRRILNFLGLGTKKCKVRELEKVRFKKKKKNETGTLQITFNEARRGSSQISGLLG